MRAHIETQIREHFSPDFEEIEGYEVVVAVIEDETSKLKFVLLKKILI